MTDLEPLLEELVMGDERTVDELGRLDTVINNAGVMLLGDAADQPLDDWQRMVDAGPPPWPARGR